MNKKLLTFILILTVLLTNGCQLAKEEVSNDSIGNEDCMIGLLITEGNRGILDHKVGTTMTLEELAEANKLYATIDKKNSKSPDKWEVTFPGVEGISFFIPEFRYGEEKYDSFVMVIGSDEISDVNNHLNVSETSESREIAGTIYVAKESGKDYIYYMNPVYQTAAGEIYVTQGNGVMGMETDGFGAGQKWNMKEEKEVTKGEEKQMQSFSVDVSLEMMFVPTKIRVLQMDIEHHILDSIEYEPGTLPEEVKCMEKTAYVVVETERVDLAGKTITEREIGTADDEGKITVETFYKGDFGALRKQTTTFVNY